MGSVGTLCVVSYLREKCIFSKQIDNQKWLFEINTLSRGITCRSYTSGSVICRSIKPRDATHFINSFTSLLVLFRLTCHFQIPQKTICVYWGCSGWQAHLHEIWNVKNTNIFVSPLTLTPPVRLSESNWESIVHPSIIKMSPCFWLLAFQWANRTLDLIVIIKNIELLAQ